MVHAGRLVHVYLFDFDLAFIKGHGFEGPLDDPKRWVTPCGYTLEEWRRNWRLGVVAYGKRRKDIDKITCRECKEAVLTAILVDELKGDS